MGGKGLRGGGGKWARLRTGPQLEQAAAPDSLYLPAAHGANPVPQVRVTTRVLVRQGQGSTFPKKACLAGILQESTPTQIASTLSTEFAGEDRPSGPPQKPQLVPPKYTAKTLENTEEGQTKSRLLSSGAVPEIILCPPEQDSPAGQLVHCPLTSIYSPILQVRQWEHVQPDEDLGQHPPGHVAASLSQRASEA